MVNFIIIINLINFFCILGVLAAIFPYKIKIPERKRILFKSRRPKKLF